MSKTLEELIVHLEGMTLEESAATHVGAPTVLFLCRELKAAKDRIARLERLTPFGSPSPHMPEHRPRK